MLYITPNSFYVDYIGRLCHCLSVYFGNIGIIQNLDKINGETYNVGGSNEVSVSLLELTQLCEKITGNRIEITSVAETKQADIPVYITDNSKITAISGWKPEIKPEQIMIEIIEWIGENEKDLENILK